MNLQARDLRPGMVAALPQGRPAKIVAADNYLAGSPRTTITFVTGRTITLPAHRLVTVL